MWKKQNIDLGRIAEKSKHTVRFQWQGPMDFEITKLSSSCGCTKPIFTKSNNTLEATFTAPTIPQHLKWKKEYTTIKKIRMNTSKDTFEFTFKATIFTK